MKMWPLLFLIGFVGSVRADEQTNSVPSTRTSGQTVETIVCIRHGEKPHGGLGQLTCRGLNRALALPDVLLAKYGAPKFVFAPNPTQKADGKDGYYYVRPLTTIEPTPFGAACRSTRSSVIGKLRASKMNCRNRNIKMPPFLSPGSIVCSMNL